MQMQIRVWQELYQQSQKVNQTEQAIAPVQFNHNLVKPVVVDATAASWLSSPASGVVRVVLERDGGEQTTRATSLVAYQPGSQFAPHSHPLGEEFLVLDGTFSDEYGDYPAGTYVRNPPNSSHQPFSREGCLIYVKLQQFQVDDTQRVVCSIAEMDVDLTGWSQQMLFDDYETVVVYHTATKNTLPDNFGDQGVEILVLEGALAASGENYSTGHWLRFPQAIEKLLMAQAGTRLLIKSAHLKNV